MKIVHYSQAVRGRRAIVCSEAERRALIRALAQRGLRALLLFCLVDDHLHAVLRSKRPGFLVRDIRRILRVPRPGLELKSPNLEPVGTRAYLTWLVEYLLTQPSKHGLVGVSSALWTGSCFQDLIGVRILPGFESGAILAELPRLRQRDLFHHVGLERRSLTAADDEALHRAGAADLVRLAAEVHGVGPELIGRTCPVVQARALAAGLAKRVELTSREVARYLGISTRAVQKLASQAIDPRAELALRRRLTLEDRVRGLGRVPTENRRS